MLTHDGSTGKRRYGHPALTGVLPHPWLPIKPGEALANFAHGGDVRARNNAVVLTLRRKKSKPLQRAEVAFSDNPTTATTTPAPPNKSNGDDDSTAAWLETGTGQHTMSPGGAAQTLRHRLSFDPASGVINLPDDVDDDEEDSDSEADLESPHGLHHAATEPRVTSGSTSPRSSEDGAASEARARRYSTYYHHPERRQSAAL